MFVFKIYTSDGLTFNLPQKQMSCAFIRRDSEEFKSLLRSPHANKNAQEQFHKVKYVYTIRFRARHRADFFLNQLQSSKSRGIIKAFTVKERTRFKFKTA